MVTPTQTFKNIRSSKRRFKRRGAKALKACPHKSAVVFGTLIITPGKPNSARRSCAIVFIGGLKGGLLVFVPSIDPRERPRLHVYAKVLLKGGGPRDVPGVNYGIVCGPSNFSKGYGGLYRGSKYGLNRDTVGVTMDRYYGEVKEEGAGLAESTTSVVKIGQKERQDTLLKRFDNNVEGARIHDGKVKAIETSYKKKKKLFDGNKLSMKNVTPLKDISWDSKEGQETLLKLKAAQGKSLGHYGLMAMKSGTEWIKKKKLYIQFKKKFGIGLEDTFKTRAGDSGLIFGAYKGMVVDFSKSNPVFVSKMLKIINWEYGFHYGYNNKDLAFIPDDEFINGIIFIYKVALKKLEIPLWGQKQSTSTYDSEELLHFFSGYLTVYGEKGGDAYGKLGSGVLVSDYKGRVYPADDRGGVKIKIFNLGDWNSLSDCKYHPIFNFLF